MEEKKVRVTYLNNGQAEFWLWRVHIDGLRGAGADINRLGRRVAQAIEYYRSRIASNPQPQYQETLDRLHELVAWVCVEGDEIVAIEELAA